MPLPAPPYADYPARLLTLQAQAAQAYADHVVFPPRSQSNFDAYLKRWCAAYEVLAELEEQNPAFARQLLPPSGTAALPLVAGLPRVPAGVLAQVGVPNPLRMTVSIDVAASIGAVGVQVALFGGAALGAAGVTQTATRATASFLARADGIYVLSLTVGGAPLATVYVLVCRAAYKLLREDSRDMGWTLGDTLPRPSAVLLGRLARLAAAEAACRTSQPALAQRLVDSALALPAAPTPTAVFPRPRHV